MDVEELDAWLGDVDEEDESAGPLWSASEELELAAAERRGRWIRIGGVAVGVWVLLGVAFALLGRGGGDLQAMPVPSMLPAVSAAPTSPPRPDASAVSTDEPDVAPGGSAADDSGSAAGPVGGDSAEADSPASLADLDIIGAASGATTWPGHFALRRAIEVAAELAVREHLIELSSTPTFVERVRVVELQALDDTVGLATVDAVWIADQRADRARLTLPVDLDARPLAEPWVTAPAEPPMTLDAEPPVGEDRLDEVRAAVELIGWSDVTVSASAPHPDRQMIWRAVVGGVDPAGIARTGQLVWLVDIDGLQVAGARP